MTELKDMSVSDLMSRMCGIERYIIINEPVCELADLQPVLKEHLIYMIELEKKGSLLASGPLFDVDGKMTGEGLTIIRADSYEQAKQVAADDPFVQAGLRRSRVRKWRLNEGRVSFEFDLSDGQFRLG